ncbi:hypothetical protein PYCC9005_000603 [Savitreella phatthalungensis]
MSEDVNGKDDMTAGGEDDPDDWQDMPAVAEHDIYDDESGKIVAHAPGPLDDVLVNRAKGYSRVQDDDAASQDSVDERTDHLFGAKIEDEATVDSQLAQTKTLLSDHQRIAYMGICKLVIVDMLTHATLQNATAHGEGQSALEALILWSNMITARLYEHIEISDDEQVMMERLGKDKIEPADLAPALNTSKKMQNPLTEAQTVALRRSQDGVEVALPDAEEVAELDQKLAATGLTNSELEVDIRWTVLFDLFLLLLADSTFDARSRALLVRVAKTLDISYVELVRFERKISEALEVQENSREAIGDVREEAQMTETRAKSSRNRRLAMMGLATIGGGLVIGLSAGLLAPVIGAGLGAAFTTVGVSGATSFLAGAGGAALITTGGVVTGSTIATRSAAKRVSPVKTFEFKPLYDNRRVNLLVTVPGWLAGSEDDVRLPFSTVDPCMGDICSVLWEPELLRTFQATGNILATEVLTQSLQQVLGQTVLTALMSALQWPLVLTKLSYLIDNPWSNSLDRAKAAGLILADTIVSRCMGARPISLVGYSLGARVIYFALLELAKVKAYGIIEDVFLFGAPVVVTAKDWRRANSVVAGRFVNGFVRNDWILGYLFRATAGGIGAVAGLRPVESVYGVENVDVTDDVDGHMGYRDAIPRLMKRMGYLVTSEEFEEIEDPDPDRQRERARELLDEIEGARKVGEKKKRSFFSWGKKNLVTPEALPAGPRKSMEGDFDVDSIRREAAEPPNMSTESLPGVSRTKSYTPGPKLVSARPPLPHAATSTAVLVRQVKHDDKPEHAEETITMAFE